MFEAFAYLLCHGAAPPRDIPQNIQGLYAGFRAFACQPMASIANRIGKGLFMGGLQDSGAALVHSQHGAGFLSGLAGNGGGGALGGTMGGKTDNHLAIPRGA